MKNRSGLSRMVYLSIVLCLLAGSVLAGCAQGTGTNSSASQSSAQGNAALAKQASQPKYGGTLKIGEYADGVSIGYPPKLLKVISNREATPAIETLLRYDETGKPVGWLATDYSNDVNSKTITLKLRKDVKFHDGTEFNAEAVKWNLDQQIAAKGPGTEKFKSVDMVDDYTVRVNLTEWDSTIISGFATTLGMIISPTAFKKNGQEWATSHPVGTGPFVFVSWDRDASVKYKKFDGYWQKGKPYLDTIEIIPIVDAVTRQMSFRGGDVDVALMLDAKDFAGLRKDGFVVTRTNAGSGGGSLIPDSANPNSPWSKLQVRQAGQYAIDTETLIKTTSNGEGETSNQWIYKGHWGYSRDVVGYPYNQTKAKQLLAEAGFPNGFTTKYTYVNSGAGSNEQATAIQGYLKEVGIAVTLNPVDNGKFNQMAYDGGGWEGLIRGPMSPNPDVVGELGLRLSGGGKWHNQMMVPDDYKQAIQRAIMAPDFEAKQKNAQEAEKLMIDKYALMIVLSAGSDSVVTNKRVHDHGYMASPNTGQWTPDNAWLGQ